MAEIVRSRMRVVVGDITTLGVDAVVTAANEALRGGGGVDGAVHAAAGPQLVGASRALAPCPAGGAEITAAFQLDAKYVIHAVGPIFESLQRDGAILASAYRSALSLATEHTVANVAFPCISTGVYGFPSEAACQIAVATVVDWLDSNLHPNVVTFCCFTEKDAKLYRTRLQSLSIGDQPKRPGFGL